jgi:hypothetical protein
MTNIAYKILKKADDVSGAVMDQISELTGYRAVLAQVPQFDPEIDYFRC